MNRITRNRLLSSGFLALLLVSPGAAQTLVYSWAGLEEGDNFGICVHRAGDVNGDGVIDAVIGAYGSERNAARQVQDAGSVAIYSGIDGTLLRRVHGSHWAGHFGRCVAGIGDVNGDGYDDVLVGATQENPTGSPATHMAGRAYVISGEWVTAKAGGAPPQTEKFLLALNGDGEHDKFGRSVSGLGDLTGDGVPDFMVGAYEPSNSGKGYVRLFSGADGSILREHRGERRSDFFGVSVKDTGDLDGDGLTEYLVGAFGWEDPATPSKIELGAAYLYRGSDGFLLKQFKGVQHQEQLGRSVSDAGDLNLDGVPDLLVGSHQWDQTPDDNVGRGIAYSGVWPGNAWIAHAPGVKIDSHFGSALAALGDVNGDGFADVAVTSSARSYVHIYSGFDGGLLYELTNPSGQLFGKSVRLLGDRDGDQQMEILIGAPQALHEGKRTGMAWLYELD